MITNFINNTAVIQNLTFCISSSNLFGQNIAMRYMISMVNHLLNVTANFRSRQYIFIYPEGVSNTLKLSNPYYMIITLIACLGKCIMMIDS